MFHFKFRNAVASLFAGNACNGGTDANPDQGLQGSVMILDVPGSEYSHLFDEHGNSKRSYLKCE